MPETVRDFHIVVHLICKKWLKERRARTLFDDNLPHYQTVATALNETISLMAEIDEVIDTQGGWPGAFAVDN